MAFFKKLLIVSILITSNPFYGCYYQKKKFPTPDAYDLNNPVIITLPSPLDEISGIVFYPKDTSVFAISDATGSLYKIYLHRNALMRKWKFGKNQDYEDLQLLDSTFYILSSKGNIVSVRFTPTDSMIVKEYQFDEKGNNEFESLYFDPELNKLMLLCKDCKEDKKTASGIWSFDTLTKKYTKEPFEVNAKNVTKEFTGKKFHPSAATINPFTNQLYILSSVNKALIIADKKGNIEKVYPLDPDNFKQPEGITFSPWGDLLISNESAGNGDADILVFKYKKRR